MLSKKILVLAIKIAERANKARTQTVVTKRNYHTSIDCRRKSYLSGPGFLLTLLSEIENELDEATTEETEENGSQQAIEGKNALD